MIKINYKELIFENQAKPIFDQCSTYGQTRSSTGVFFKHFASKNQLPGIYINGTLVENSLTL